MADVTHVQAANGYIKRASDYIQELETGPEVAQIAATLAVAEAILAVEGRARDTSLRAQSGAWGTDPPAHADRREVH